MCVLLRFRRENQFAPVAASPSMKYNDFIEELRQAGLTGRSFARLLHLHPNSISNYKAAGEVPSHLAVIAALIHTMKDAGVDYAPTIARLPLTKKSPRGRAIMGMERGPNTPETPKVVTCPRCGGSGKVSEQGQQKPCSPCNGTGKVKDR